MDDATKKLHILKHGYFTHTHTHIQPSSIKDVYSQYSFKVDIQDQHQPFWKKWEIWSQSVFQLLSYGVEKWPEKSLSNKKLYRTTAIAGTKAKCLWQQPCSASGGRQNQKETRLAKTSLPHLRVYQRWGRVRFATHPRQGQTVQPGWASWLTGDNTLTFPYCTLRLSLFSLFSWIFSAIEATG